MENFSDRAFIFEFAYLKWYEKINLFIGMVAYDLVSTESGNCTYDTDGNVQTDSRNALNFSYNVLNLVSKVRSGGRCKDFLDGLTYSRKSIRFFLIMVIF